MPRVRLFDRVPILETEELVRSYLNRPEQQRKLVKNAIEVSKGSAHQFSLDDRGLTTLLDEIGSSEYVVTKRSKAVLEALLDGIYDDGLIFKEFEDEIEPLCHVSQPLREVSKLADALADRTKEESIDAARALMIRLPKRTPETSSTG